MCREVQSADAPAEPARRCLSPRSNSGTPQSYERRFKVLQSASCLRSYLAVTLPPRPLTKLALGDNRRGFATIHNQQQGKYSGVCCIQLTDGKGPSQPVAAYEVSSALHIPGVESAFQYNLNFIKPPASVYPFNNFSKATKSVSLPSQHQC